jgi:hypothetical protein
MLDTRDSVRGRHRRHWITRSARGLRGRVMKAVINRVATHEMHHAALLLGYDIALGHGREGIFRYLNEFDIGTEIGRSVRYGKPAEREGAVEALILELCLFS